VATLKTHISWTHSTWNPTTGCTKMSAGCDFCYAEALTIRLWGGNFDQVKTHPDRLGQARKFTPLQVAGELVPRMVFVNSMSDLMHKDIPDGFRDQVFDAIEATPFTVYQVLTKRPMTLLRYIEGRYKASGVPANLWLGTSVEDNRVKGRIDFLRRLKDSVGAFTAFLSVEPLIGVPDEHDYTGIDQVLIGGESGPKARDMPLAAPRTSRDLARAAGAAVWFKQFGQWRNNPYYQATNGPTHLERVRQAIAAGEREARIETDDRGRSKILGEKGGATLDGEVLHELPPAYARLQLELRRQAA
jgi:protein gp37